MKKFVVAALAALAIATSAHADVKRIETPGGWYGENGTDGRRAVLVTGSHVDTHLGRVELPRLNGAPDNVLFLRVAPHGDFKMCGQSHGGAGTYEWTIFTREWTVVGPSFGVNACIYDLNGQLHIGSAQFGTQGFRYVRGVNELVLGDLTYADPARKIWEYTTMGSYTVGQGEGGCIALFGNQRRMLEPGHCTFARYNRDGDINSVYFVKLLEGKSVEMVFRDADFEKFPLETPVTTPAPVPTPVPVPTPTPVPPQDVHAPNRFDVVERVARDFPGLLDINTIPSICEFTTRVLEALGPEWGYVGKTAGEGQCQPPNFTPQVVDGHQLTGVSYDVIFHKPTHRQIDIGANATANERCDLPPDQCWARGPARVMWGEVEPQFYRPNNPWVALTGRTTTPDPIPNPEPPADTTAFKQRIAELESLLFELTKERDSLQVTAQAFAEMAVKLEAKVIELDTEVEKRKTNPCEFVKVDGFRIFGIRLPPGECKARE